MKYLSNYNGYVIKDDFTYVYNTEYMNVIKVNSNNINEVKEYLSGVDNQELIDLGFLTNSANQIDLELEKYKHMKNSKQILHIMLFMTYDCNCNCDYCFEDVNIPKESRKENLDSVAEYIIKLYNTGYDGLELSFFGGEPLLEYENIIYIFNKINKNIANLKSVVITNGTLITEDIVKNLKDAGIYSYQITLDGPKNIHDQRRPCKNGTSSWDNIQDGLIVLNDHDCEISIRVNIDSENVNRLTELCNNFSYDLLNNKSFLIYISPIVGCLDGTVNSTLKNRAETIKKAWKIIEKDSLPIKINPPVYAPCPYHSKESAFYIDMSGNIYTCGGFVGDSNKIERNFDNYNDIFSSRIKYTPEAKCFNCTFFPVCMGGCRFEFDRFEQNCQYKYLKEVYDEYFTKYL